jgi:hypothetical protein
MAGALEKWQELCQRVIEERDPHRLTELLKMLNDELEKRELRKKARAQQDSSKGDGKTVA